jgi:hypothetical protein
MISPGFIETAGARGMIVAVAKSRGIDENAARQAIMEMIGGIPIGSPHGRRRSPNWLHSCCLIELRPFMALTT